MKITASHTVEGYADRVNKCRIGIQFGVNGATDRLFLSGSPQLINYDWYSGLNDPTYWGDQAVFGAGPERQRHCGIFHCKRPAGGATRIPPIPTANVIVREGTLVDNKPAFPIVNILQGEGAIGPYSFGYLGTEPLFLTKLGVYAITAQDITGEKYSQSRELLPEREAAGGKRAGGAAFALVYKDMYWLCLNGRAYILDGLQATQTDRSAPYSTRQYAGFYCTNIPARVLWEQDGALWFGTADGRLCAFANEPSDPLNYNDNGEAIYACWRTPDLSGQTFYRNKTFSRFYVALASALATGVRAWGRVAGIWEELFSDFVTARYFSYAHLIYSKFTYSNDDTPRTLGDKIRLKKVDKAGFKVENGVLNEPFGLDSIGIEFVETGYYRA